MSKVKVSVIIPFYNNIQWLEEAIESVYSQTYSNYEIIVVNDGSKEDMSDFIHKYSADLILINKNNGGPASARNIGIDRAQGEYIAFLDSDDLWLKNKLEVQMKYMERTSAEISHTAYSTFGAGKRYTSSPYITSGKAYPKILAKCVIATPTVIIKTDILKQDKTLRFNEEMRYGQDYYLWIHCSTKYNIHVIDESLSLVRMRGSNASKRVRVQVQVKSFLWEELKNQPSKYRLSEVPYLIKMAYALSFRGNKIINKFSKSFKNPKIIEFISRLVYIIPYLMFKYTSNKL